MRCPSNKDEIRRGNVTLPKKVTPRGSVPSLGHETLENHPPGPEGPTRHPFRPPFRQPPAAPHPGQPLDSPPRHPSPSRPAHRTHAYKPPALPAGPSAFRYPP